MKRGVFCLGGRRMTKRQGGRFCLGRRMIKKHGGRFCSGRENGTEAVFAFEARRIHIEAG